MAFPPAAAGQKKLPPWLQKQGDQNSPGGDMKKTAMKNAIQKRIGKKKPGAK